MTDEQDRSSERRGIVVGIDASAGSDAALRWAIAAATSERPARPVFAWQYPYTVWVPAGVGGAPAPSADLMQAEAERAAEEILAGVDRTHCEDPVVTRGDPGVVLVDQATDAELRAVGTRGHGAMASRLIGSVSRYCTDNASSPVAVIPGDTDLTTPRTIVVGVDGSDNGDAALEWAVRFAAPDDTIRAINAWNFIVGVAYSRPPLDPVKVAAASREVVEDVADRVCAAAGVEPTRVAREIVDGDPRKVLHDLQDEADLVVVGARGRTGLAHLVLGSTASSLVHRPSCPIVVVPHP